MLAEDIAKMMAMIPLDEAIRRDNETDKIKGGAFDQEQIPGNTATRAVS